MLLHPNRSVEKVDAHRAELGDDETGVSSAGAYVDDAAADYAPLREGEVGILHLAMSIEMNSARPVLGDGGTVERWMARLPRGLQINESTGVISGAPCESSPAEIHCGGPRKHRQASCHAVAKADAH